MKNFLSFLLFFPLATQAQYYYNDIIGTKTLNERMKLYVENNVKTVTATGYDPQGVKTSDFNEWQEVDMQTATLKIATRNGQRIERHSYHFDDQFRIIDQVDSSGTIKSISTYHYDTKNELISLTTITFDSLNYFNDTTEHQYFYNSSGKPEKLWRIINGKDTTEYRFTLDEKGNVADEQVYRHGHGSDPVYYYYDPQNRLTDIVRYNKRLKKLLPDFMFEYDDNNRVSQKITVVSAIPPDYLIWRYAYNEKGLKVREVLFKKDKERSGRIDYAYIFGN